MLGLLYLLTGDFDFDDFAQLSTFVLSNVAPQYHEFNAGKLYTIEIISSMQSSRSVAGS